LGPAACQPIIPDRAAADGLAKYRLVAEWRKMIAAQPWGKKDEATQAFLAAYNTGRLLPSVYETLGQVGDKTLYRMDKRLRESEDDYRALSDGRGGWRLHGTTKWRTRELCREAQEEFLRCYLDPKRPSVSLSIRAARLLLEKRGVAEDSSDATWRRWLQDYEQRNQHVVVLAREGEKAYDDNVGPYITRDDSVLEVGQVLVADGHDLNFQILHPSTGKPVRMALITFFDWASRMPVGIQIMPTESTIAIQAALRAAIVSLGKIPRSVYLDNGKAFKARVFTKNDVDLQDLTGIYARLGIATQFAQPYNARAKILERWHLTLNEQCERIIPTYTGASIGDKPAWMSRNEKLHRAWHQARTQGWVPNIREAAYMIQRYIDWYGQQPHGGLGGRRPIDVLDAGRGPGVDVDALNREFLWREEVTPRRCRVKLYGIDYESDCLHGWAGKAIAHYDTADLSRIYLYSPDGAYLGDAQPVQALHPLAKLFGDEVSVDQVKTEIARQRRLEKQTAEGLRALGAAPETIDGLKSLPWNQKAAVLPGGKSNSEANSDDSSDTSTSSAADDDAERARLQLVYSRLESEAVKVDPPGWAIPKPENFALPWVRYDWCFRVRYEHDQVLDEVDAAFMGWFELEPDFEIHRQRYADLRELFALQSGK
jgi:putative transposase